MLLKFDKGAEGIFVIKLFLFSLCFWPAITIKRLTINVRTCLPPKAISIFRFSCQFFSNLIIFFLDPVTSEVER